jgi:hypothetical protein
VMSALGPYQEPSPPIQPAQEQPARQPAARSA